MEAASGRGSVLLVRDAWWTMDELEFADEAGHVT